jgi:hypothetical protein
VIQPGGLQADVPAPAPPPAVPPGVTLVCAAGQTLQPALKCCPLYMQLDAAGQCQSPCPNGAKDPVSMRACHFGYAPPFDPVSFNPLTSLCWDGSKPIAQMVPGGVNPVCPAPKNAVCSFGYNKVPPPKSFQSLVLTWSDATCEPTAEQQKCAAGQQAGFDGQCHQLCGADQRAHLSGQCCPAGAAVSFDGKCIVPHALPAASQPAPAPPIAPPPPGDPVVCAPGYVATAGGQCCLASQMTAGGLCCPAGTAPRSDGTCGPQPWLPGRAEPQPLRPAFGVACPSGHVRLASGACCPASQATVGGQCCPPGQRPDSRRQRCIPAPGIAPPLAPATCPRGFVRLPGGDCCARGQMTAGGQCCPPGLKPDARRRVCVPATSPVTGRPAPQSYPPIPPSPPAIDRPAPKSYPRPIVRPRPSPPTQQRPSRPQRPPAQPKSPQAQQLDPRLLPARPLPAQRRSPPRID